MIKKLTIALVLLAVFFVSSRSLLFGQLFYTHDYVHGARIVEMARGLQDGVFPVWWSEHFGYGYGMPLFLFYGPLPYYFGAVLFMLTNSLVWSVLLLLVTANMIAIVGAYLVGKTFSGRVSGLFLALAYGLAPYRAVNLFVRGALNETWALALLPWLVLGWVLIAQNKKKQSWLLVALSVFAITITHNISALFMLPTAALLGILAAVWFQAPAAKSLKNVLRTLIQGSLGTFLGIGLSAFYSFPALLEKSATKIDQLIVGGYFDFHHHFLYLRQFLQDRWSYGGSGWGPDDGISFFVGSSIVLVLFMLALYLFAQLVSKKRIEKRLLIITLILFLSAGLMLLTTQKSTLLWETITPLAYVQFPWRLLSVITFSLAFVGSIFLAEKLPFRTIVLLVLFVVGLTTSWRYFQPQAYLEQPEQYYYDNEEKIERQMSEILPDYIPIKVVLPIEPSPNLITNLDEKYYQVLVTASNRKLIKLSLRQPHTLVFGIADFPGWSVYLDGKLIPTRISSEGLLSVELPEGDHYLSVIFGYTPIRTLGLIVSITSVTMVFLLHRLNEHKKRSILF